MLDNHLVLAGVVRDSPQTRYTPAGIPITSFRLQHRSGQQEAGHTREAVCTLQVVISGDALQKRVEGLEQGSSIRVSGFICRANYRQGEYRLVLHGQHIETI